MQNGTESNRSTSRHDTRLIRDILPRLTQARAMGAQGLDELHQVISQQMIEDGVPGKKLSRSRLYRALQRLAALGLDTGLDDRCTARRRRMAVEDKREDKRAPETRIGIRRVHSPPKT